MSQMTMTLQTWRGYSAYEIAVQNGFQGTESEWLESLKGEPGENAQAVTVNNLSPVGGNITLRGTDIYVRPGLGTTVTQMLDGCITQDKVVDNLDSTDASKALSAAQGHALKLLAQGLAAVSMQTVTLTAASWTQTGGLYQQTAQVPGLTADTAKTAAIVTPSTNREEEAAYLTAQVRASAQGEGTLTFTALTLPTGALTAQVLVVTPGVSA